MSFIHTVPGDIPAAEFGVCAAPEHVIIAPSFTTHLYPDSLLTDFSAPLRAGGVSDALWQRMFVFTPADTFAFTHPKP